MLFEVLWAKGRVTRAASRAHRRRLKAGSVVVVSEQGTGVEEFRRWEEGSIGSQLTRSTERESLQLVGF